MWMPASLVRGLMNDIYCSCAVGDNHRAPSTEATMIKQGLPGRVLKIKSRWDDESA